MAEYVQQNLEGMLPELEEMERMGVFSSDEIRWVKFTAVYLSFGGEHVFNSWTVELIPATYLHCIENK